MLIPVAVESAEDFLERVRGVLAQDGTHIYVDTSLVMWLTALGPTSRASFVQWAETFGDHVHVPAWTVQEYYRHYRDRTQTTAIADKCLAVEQAIDDLAKHMRVYADGSLSPGQPEMAFVKELEEARQGMRRATKVARGWDHEVPAAEIINWMNARVLPKTRVFDGFSELKRRGGQRYSHEVPPGFEDGHKGQNRFGDLLFWEDVVADAAERKAKTVVIFTRDRKKDWFYSRIDAHVGQGLKQLSGRWPPVPVPHPMLSLELKSAAKAELLLVDELYMGGLMWLADKARFGRLAAVTFGRDIDWLAERLAPPPTVAARSRKRDAADTIALLQASRILKAAKAAPSEAVEAVLASLAASAPTVDDQIASFTPAKIASLDGRDTAALSRQLYVRALEGPSAEEALARRLIDSIDAVDAEHASAIIVGMLVGAYFTGTGTRERPIGDLLPEVLSWRADPGIRRVLDLLASTLKSARSPALWYPSASDTPLPVRIDAASGLATTPVSVGRIFVGEQSVLVRNALEPESELSAQLGGRSIATAREVVEAVARYYGIPSDLVQLADAEPGETRTIVAGSGFERFDQSKQPLRTTSSKTSAVEAALHGDGSEEAPAGEAPNAVTPMPDALQAGGVIEVEDVASNDAEEAADDPFEGDVDDDEDYDDEEDQ